jgi:U3 small nucleolar RNA-associated protein 3
MGRNCQLEYFKSIGVLRRQRNLHYYNPFFKRKKTPRRHPQDELDEYYNSVREGRKKRKQDRDEAHQRTADYLPEEEAEEKRGINWQMQKNKGLTPHRSKVNNPRVKHKVCGFSYHIGREMPAFDEERVSL